MFPVESVVVRVPRAHPGRKWDRMGRGKRISCPPGSGFLFGAKVVNTEEAAMGGLETVRRQGAVDGSREAQ